MKFAVHNHQGKADALIAALEAGGHELVKNGAVDFLMIDFDGPGMYERMIEKHVIKGAKIFLYSHGAMPLCGWDGIWEPSDRVSAYLAMTPGQAEVMRRHGYPHDIHVIGWHYCDILPFQPVAKPKKILFAPWHPHSTGYLMAEGKELNHRIFEELIGMLPEIELTVRHLRTLHQNGLWEEPGVHYIQVYPDNSTDDIDEADLVISHGTFAYLAIARGKRTIMYGQDVRPHDGVMPDKLRFVASWEKYKDYVRYPYHYHPGEKLSYLFAWNRINPWQWKHEFIGSQFDPTAFCGLIEELMTEVVYA